MGLETPEQVSLPATFECRFLLRKPSVVDSRTLLVLTLHGYASNPETMLRLTSGLVGPDALIAALEGPHQFFQIPNDFHSEVVFGWGTRKHWDSCVRVHHEMLLRVLAEMRARFGIGGDRAMLTGFSQPVSMNYRFASSHPGAVRGVVAFCGGIPSDWEKRAPPKIEASVLHIAREQDPYYPPAVSGEQMARLSRFAPDLEYHLMPGGHRVPSAAAPILESWMGRVWPGARAVRANGAF